MPDEDAIRQLQAVCDDKKQPTYLRAQARSLLTQWSHGVVPDMAAVRRVRLALVPVASCTRAEFDGGCAWIRKWGGSYGIQLPPRGTRALCQFPSEQTRCPGYETSSEESD